MTKQITGEDNGDGNCNNYKTYYTRRKQTERIYTENGSKGGV